LAPNSNQNQDQKDGDCNSSTHQYSRHHTP
jgi:hypothetical protein